MVQACKLLHHLCVYLSIFLSRSLSPPPLALPLPGHLSLPEGVHVQLIISVLAGWVSMTDTQEPELRRVFLQMQERKKASSPLLSGLD